LKKKSLLKQFIHSKKSEEGKRNQEGKKTIPTV